MDNVTEVPVLDVALARSPDTKPQFLAELRDALVRVGFFYIKNHSMPEELVRRVLQRSGEFFELPAEKKREIDARQSRHFRGYSSISTQKTGGDCDHSEVLLLGADLPAPGPEKPTYLNIQGPCQWPDETSVPAFRKDVESYRFAVQKLSDDFNVWIAEALELRPNAFDGFFGDSPSDFAFLNLRCYPPPVDPTNGAGRQGVGAHKDDSVMTFLLQQNERSCLEIQNKSGQWIAVPPIPGTLVANIGRMLEYITRGVCTATTHRVQLKPECFVDSKGAALGARLSIGFFQHIDYCLTPEDLALDLAPHIADIVKGEKVISHAEELFSGVIDNSSGDRLFVNFLSTVPEVGKKWYPEYFSRMQQDRGVC